jgi:hypothetical protein
MPPGSCSLANCAASSDCNPFASDLLPENWFMKDEKTRIGSSSLETYSNLSPHRDLPEIDNSGPMETSIRSGGPGDAPKWGPPVPVNRRWDHPGHCPISLHYGHLRHQTAWLALRPYQTPWLLSNQHPSPPAPPPLSPNPAPKGHVMIPKSPCSAGKATPGAAAERSFPRVLKTEPLPRPRFPRPKQPSWPTCFLPDLAWSRS